MAHHAGIFKYQTFSLTAPNATKVLLVGSFTRWIPVAMRRNDDGIWTHSVELGAGTHHYLFIVDDQWKDAPDGPLRVPNPAAAPVLARQAVP